MATADELKAKGNAAFQAGKNTEAVNWFTQAIALDSSNHILYSNRSAAYCADNLFGPALTDAKKTVELKPDWAKGYTRVGAALIGLERFDEARDAYNEGLKVEPENQACKEGLQQASASANSGKNPIASMFGPDSLQRIAANPKLAKYLAQPDYVQMITMIQQNPNMANVFLQQDKRLMETFLHLAGMGDMKMPMGDDEEEEEERPKPPPKKQAEKPAAANVNAETRDRRTKAEAEKEKGNEHYKKKQFPEALEAYDRAIEIDSENLLYRLNKAAVYLEQAEFQKCIQECDETLEAIRSRKADFTLTAKALARKATAFHRQGDLEGAIKLYKESLTEHRTADVLDKLNKLEREKKEKETQAYLDPEKGAEAKERGNVHFRENRYPEAIKEYSEAVKRDPKNHTYYSNRAAAYMKLGEHQMAINDCDEALKLDPTFVKAITRKAQCYYFRKEYHKALDWYEKGLAMDKDNEECKAGIERTIQQVQAQAGSGEVDEDRVRKAMSDPEIQNILQDPIMQSVLRECGESPGALNKHMQNPGVAEKIRKLMMAGVLRTG